jgi:hypothetical protein
MRVKIFVFVIVFSLVSCKGVLAQGANQTEIVTSEQKSAMSESKPLNGQEIPSVKNPTDKAEVKKSRTTMSVAAYKSLSARKIAA